MSTDIARAAFELLSRTADRLEPADHDRPSNCDGWTVRDVVAHVTGSVVKAQRLALDQPLDDLPSDPAAWHHPHAAAELTRACQEALAALEQADPAAPRTLRGQQMPLAAAVSFPVVDAMVHAWDIEHSLGRSLELPPELLAYANALTEKVGTAPTPSFAAPVEPPADATDTERLMARLGRQVR